MSSFSDLVKQREEADNGLEDITENWYGNANKLTEALGSKEADRVMFETEFIKGDHSVYKRDWWKSVLVSG